MLAELTWLGSGALISFGIVGFLTGLVLVPFGVALAFVAARTRQAAWPLFLVGLGLGPTVLLSDDAVAAEPPAGAVPAFWVGLALLVAGMGLSVYVGWRTRT